MRKLLKSKIVLSTLLFTLLHIVAGLLVLAPLLVYMRVIFENTGSALKLWPMPSIDVIADMLINNTHALILYIIAAFVIHAAFMPMRVLLSAGIYDFIISGESETEGSGVFINHLKSAVAVWTGFIKIEFFSLPVYLAAFIIGLSLGSILDGIAGFFRPLTLILMLFFGSTYLQLLRIWMIGQGTSSLRKSITDTRRMIAESLGRILLGNFSVLVAGFIAILLPWWLLKITRAADWSLMTASISLLLQQLIVLLAALAQVLRINYNHSIIRKGE